jgi:hypothetical protein
MSSFEMMLQALKELFNQKDKAHLKVAEKLGRIADLLDEVAISVKAGMIPRQQSYEMAMLVNFVNDDLKGVILIPHIRPIFEERLPKVGRLMEEVDVLIYDWQRQKGVMARGADFPVMGDKDQELYAEIQRAVGELRGAAAGLSAGRKPPAA